MRGISDQIAHDLEKASEDLLVRQKALSDWSESWNRTHEGEVLELLLPRITQEKNEYAFRLRTQSENKRKMSQSAGRTRSCRKQSERWAKLNDLAGSADGAKFRRIAQGYTLDVLLSYANVQLRDLSRRYRLERVPETLALQVIDRDMCDEVRTVHSLSGGESFLVSLALALGLSSLSSNRMKVESLFIGRRVRFIGCRYPPDCHGCSGKPPYTRPQDRSNLTCTGDDGTYPGTDSCEPCREWKKLFGGDMIGSTLQQ